MVTYGTSAEARKGVLDNDTVDGIKVAIDSGDVHLPGAEDEESLKAIARVRQAIQRPDGVPYSAPRVKEELVEEEREEQEQLDCRVLRLLESTKPEPRPHGRSRGIPPIPRATHRFLSPLQDDAGGGEEEEDE